MEALINLVSSGSSFILLIGFFLPPIIDLINNHVKNSELRWWVAQAFYMAVSGFLVWITNSWQGLAPIQVLEMVAVAFFAVGKMGELTYKKLGWEKSQVREDLGLDAKTS